MGLITEFVSKVEHTVERIVEGLTEKVHQVPVYDLGLKNVPAIPFKIEGLLGTLANLAKRNTQTKQAVYGLSNVYTIDGVTHPAHVFLWGEADADKDGEKEHPGDLQAGARAELQDMLEKRPRAVGRQLQDQMDDEEKTDADDAASALTTLSLEEPEQFSMSWTTFPKIYSRSLPLLDGFCATLTDADVATREYWPTISKYGMPYNLLFVEKVDTDRAAEFGALLGAWSEDLKSLQEQKQLYAIDLRIFEGFAPQQAKGAERFAPATVTLLRQDPETKNLEPIVVRVSGEGGKDARVFRRGEATDSAWLYALQASKASIGVYGIWLGHVYHWHIPTAAVQMTMYNCLPEEHPLYRLLHPHSQYLIEFDTLLLLKWKDIAPPTPIVSSRQFLILENSFAEGRTFYDDDPTVTLERHGVTAEDFSVEKSWDRYEFVGRLLHLWEITGNYVTDVVEALYADDAAVVADEKLQHWMKETADPEEGNIRGIPEMNSRAALSRFLQSYLYRITAHGSSRLPSAANPGLTFVPNFPPCLQRSDIPEPTAEMDTRELLTYLPNTGTIGAYLSFFYIFSFSTPSESVVPIDGVDSDLFFDNDDAAGRKCNEAQIRYRKAIIEVMTEYQDGAPQVTQWARNIET